LNHQKKVIERSVKLVKTGKKEKRKVKATKIKDQNIDVKQT
jgi:hypothetical protein